MKIHVTSICNKFTIVALLVALIGSAVQVTPAYAAGIVVNTNADNEANDGLCTLREAILAAGNDARSGTLAGECVAGSLAGVDSITFAANYIITVGSQLPFISNPPAKISNSVTITGKGAANTIIQANVSSNVATWRVFQVTPTGNLTLDGVTVRNGRCNGLCTAVGGIEPNGGGGIYNSGTLTFTNSILSGSSGTLGGGIFNNGGTVTVSNSQILSNEALQGGGGDGGGGIRNTGTLTVTNSTFSGNNAPGGSGILNFLHLTVKDSTFSGNTATYGAGILNGKYNCPSCINDATIENTVFSGNTAGNQGGAMYSHAYSTVTVTDSTFTNNKTRDGGGGITNFGALLTITGSTFSGNSSTTNSGYGGGGIINYAGGTLTVTNSTFFNNTSAFNGGGISGDNLTVTNSTFAGNSAPVNSGGGIFLYSGTATLKNTLLANNSGGNCFVSGTITNAGNNLDSGTSCGWGTNNGSLSNTNPLLGPLANNGGHTKTMALLAGSPAIDAASDATCAAAVGSPDYGAGGKDQRGGARPQGSHCDIGAFESGAPVTFISGFSDVPNNYWALVFIERLFEAGITGGCSTSPLQYCPETTVTRAQMAIFLERGIHGSSYNPPAVGGSTGFNDVPLAYWAGAWIKQLAADGITGGCGSGSYCPEGAVTRAQMAVFLLRSEHGAGYNPPDVGAGTGFSDVPPSYWAAAWIKQLVAEGITAGCGTGTYCPESSVTRAQMAVFLVRTFNLP